MEHPEALDLYPSLLCLKWRDIMEQRPRFSIEHEQVLRNLVIGDASPGTIIRDFEALLSYIRTRDLSVTGKHQLPLRALPEINARLSHPIQLGLKRPQQKSYPHINGLYLLLRASGLTYIDETSKKPLLVVEDEVYREWAGLNPTERYCCLLEIWLLRGDPEIIGARQRGGYRIPDTFKEWRSFFQTVPDEGMQVSGNDEADSWMRYWLGWHNLGLLEMFGLMVVEHGTPQPGEGWCVDRVHRASLGDALLALLHIEFFGDIDNILELEAEEKMPLGVLQPALKTYFPEWEKCISTPEWAFREGTYIFKVSLWRIWRQIAIPADLTLDTLASTILDAVEFDDDHLYMFSYENRFGREERVYHPYMDEGPWTSEMLIGNVPLGVGQTMTFLFDFGDQWEFDVTLERIDPQDTSVRDPIILKTHGEPPQQYPIWDEEDF
jgi:hypothetical protein